MTLPQPERIVLLDYIVRNADPVCIHGDMLWWVWYAQTDMKVPFGYEFVFLRHFPWSAAMEVDLHRAAAAGLIRRLRYTYDEEIALWEPGPPLPVPPADEQMRIYMYKLEECMSLNRGELMMYHSGLLDFLVPKKAPSWLACHEGRE